METIESESSYLTDKKTRDSETKLPGCKHYERGCYLSADCCDTFFPCRMCHDETMDSYKLKEKAHTVDRFKFSKMKCRFCETEQPIGNKCTGCNRMMASYFCEKCNLFDYVDKSQFHCNDCGFCRAGGREKYEHCDDCGMCVTKELHNCKGKTDTICPVCMEDTFDSTRLTSGLKCGHWMHIECMTEYLKTNIKCPLCSKSIVNIESMEQYMDHMIESTSMPEEYKDKMVEILCNDCNKKSNVKFHFHGHKCLDSECRSYNTRLI